MQIGSLIQNIGRLPGCEVYAPGGMLSINATHRMPEDLQQFYATCGGLVLFANAEYPLTLVPPNEFVLANPVIVGEVGEDDISSSWYIVAHGPSSEFLTIDLDEQRLGKCYDSFSDRHGIPGSCPVIAASFTDLLKRLIENRGRHWYWLEPGFDLGDAYD